MINNSSNRYDENSKKQQTHIKTHKKEKEAEAPAPAPQPETPLQDSSVRDCLF